MANTRYDLRKTKSGWTVRDTAKGTPAIVKDAWRVDLTLEAADELADGVELD